LHSNDPQLINQQSQRERDCGDWQVGRFAWKLEIVSLVENVSVIGKQGLFVVDIELNYK
jgi:hypothetical protein